MQDSCQQSGCPEKAHSRGNRTELAVHNGLPAREVRQGCRFLSRNLPLFVIYLHGGKQKMNSAWQTLISP